MKDSDFLRFAMQKGRRFFARTVAIPQVPDEMQKAFEAVKQIMQVRKRGAVPMAMVHTYGCQQNAADGERMKGMLSQMGFSFTDSPTRRTWYYLTPVPYGNTRKTGCSAT